MQENGLRRKSSAIALMAFPPVLFVLLLFSEPTMLFGWTDGAADEILEVNDVITSVKHNYIEIEIDSTIAYAPEHVRAGLVYDFTNNKLVWEKNLEEQFPIASLTKMMVALITMEHIRERKVSMDDMVTISRDATRTGGSRVYLRAGQKLSVGDLLEAAMIRSGNDAAHALAEFVGGTEEKFTYLMNNRSEELGMTNTCFHNSTGMPLRSSVVPDNESTAGDLVLLARELVKYEDLLDMTSRSTETIRNANGEYTYSNRNTLVEKYDEIDGLKTGYTNAAKYCVVATSKRCDHRVITILLGVENKATRYDIAVNLFNNYYNSIGLGKLGEEFDTASAE